MGRVTTGLKLLLVSHSAAMIAPFSILLRFTTRTSRADYLMGSEQNLNNYLHNLSLKEWHGDIFEKGTC